MTHLPGTSTIARNRAELSDCPLRWKCPSMKKSMAHNRTKQTRKGRIQTRWSEMVSESLSGASISRSIGQYEHGNGYRESEPMGYEANTIPFWTNPPCVTTDGEREPLQSTDSLHPPTMNHILPSFPSSFRFHPQIRTSPALGRLCLATRSPDFPDACQESKYNQIAHCEQKPWSLDLRLLSSGPPGSAERWLETPTSPGCD
mmetsp:Transcript_11474/g.19665  ORF Transcript_11474/g.19665 Transcript_11474/m.19665 type:complete len:202 (+) Transcript_11474:757-1362(+)